MSAALTMGVEEEFYLVDAAGDLVQQGADTVDDAAGEADLKPELMRSQVESGSAVCRDHDALLADLAELRTRLADAARHRDARLLACGTAVCKPADPQRVAETPRYRRIARHVGRFVVDATTCGCHVHVGVADREIAVRVSDFLRPWLPALLAVSANSPFHYGADTGYASARYLLWGRWPTAGPPPHLESVDRYERIVQGLLDSGAALDRGMIYWDIRPSEHQPTVEIRVADTLPTAAEATFLAVLVRTLVAEALERLDRGERAEPVAHEVLRASLWRAARDGLDAVCADPVSGSPRPVRHVLAGLVSRCGQSEVDFAGAVLARLCETGGGAARQRAALRRRGRLTDVVDLLATQTLR